MALIDNLPDDARDVFENTFDVTRSDDLDAAIAKVRKGDADVAPEERGGRPIAHYTRARPGEAAATYGSLLSFVDAAEWRSPVGPPTFIGSSESRTDHCTIQFADPEAARPGRRLSATFGARDPAGLAYRSGLIEDADDSPAVAPPSSGPGWSSPTGSSTPW